MMVLIVHFWKCHSIQSLWNSWKKKKMWNLIFKTENIVDTFISARIWVCQRWIVYNTKSDTFQQSDVCNMLPNTKHISNLNLVILKNPNTSQYPTTSQTLFFKTEPLLQFLFLKKSWVNTHKATIELQIWNKQTNKQFPQSRKYFSVRYPNVYGISYLSNTSTSI